MKIDESVGPTLSLFIPCNGSAESSQTFAATATPTNNGCGAHALATGRLMDLSATFTSQYSYGTSRYLKEVQRRREDVPALRVLPKTHLLAQLVLLEQTGRELSTQQEKLGRHLIAQKREEERLKREEQRVQHKNRERFDELKKKQAAELAALKESVSSFQRQIDAEVKEKLRVVCMLQPRMSVAATVLAEVKNEGSPCLLLAEMMEEERRLSKALKVESRHSKGSADSGALPQWMHICVAGSFNVAAILQDVPYRATVEDAIRVTNTSLRKLVVVRHLYDKQVVAWVHVRAGSDPAALAAELARLPAPVGLPAKMNCGVVWPKEDIAELTRKTKAATDVELQQQLRPVVDVSGASFSCAGLTTHEFTKRDVDVIGSLASA
ncbi:hypothetical protein TraAM80_08630 [Trypanosoma rangeli]|uniref:Uncharacterized protein n=1 Tax=Trypanosoma rangeli TaxID=5698 RepID=A0A3R7JY16_TRYRA|nr:uncharacterized protein TraAM80_08630 [Trypanosoma rangeli]RNE98691.1 hypothetical protein TraAM80_08630 [Trypanosoma rangeli]|eukprot:RNE98691.1 hypothetical protein TraAM80_08630 [Trypanosoma rangeli]